MGMLWDLIQTYIDKQPFPPSERQIAAKLGVAPNALRYWRDPKKLPARENLEGIANLIGVRYSVVLDAALRDTGYHETQSAGVVHLGARRPPEQIEAELAVEEENLREVQRLRVSGDSAQQLVRDQQARVDALRAQLVASRSVSENARTVAES